MMKWAELNADINIQLELAGCDDFKDMKSKMVPVKKWIPEQNEIKSIKYSPRGTLISANIVRIIKWSLRWPMGTSFFNFFFSPTESHLCIPLPFIGFTCLFHIFLLEFSFSSHHHPAAVRTFKD